MKIWRCACGALNDWPEEEPGPFVLREYPRFEGSIVYCRVCRFQNPVVEAVYTVTEVEE